jgi:CheY-like chemotaxis protein
MDVQMPIMDGLEATRRIRSLPMCQRGRLPIVAMTANVFKDDIEACLAAGMDDHISKPLDIDKVLEKLREYTSINKNRINFACGHVKERSSDPQSMIEQANLTACVPLEFR